MQRVSFVLGLFLALIAVLQVSSASAQEAAAVTTVPAWYYVTARPCLNLRSGPSGSYRVIECMPANRIVRVRSLRASGWARVYDPKTGALGWAAGSYLKLYHRPAAADPPSSGGAICLTNYWNEYVCSSADTGNAIRYWAAQYGIGWYWLAATAACESSFSLYVVNSISGVSGLFQFEPDTFWAWSGVDLWDAWDQSRVAARMFAAGEARQFYCAILIGYA